MSEHKQQELESDKQSVSCVQSLIATNTDSEELDSLKHENKKLKSDNQTLRAQNKLFRSHASSDTPLLLQQNSYRRESMTNKRICLRSYTQKKWSFSERICDDLSEVILQFLPIEDKFRFECVSKQFQRTVYRRQYELIVNNYEMIKSLTNLKSILKKLPNIKSLIFEESIPVNESLIDLIIKNCNQLTQFEGSLNGITEESKQLFAKIFGPQLTSLIISDSSYDSIISSFVNIRDIDLIYYKEMTDEFHTKFNVKNLRKLSTHIPSPLIDANLKTSKLNQLISLKLDELDDTIELKSVANYFKQLSLNCLKLKQLSLDFCLFDEDFQKNDFMREIQFKELKRLDINFLYTEIEFQEYVINSLKTGFKHLTHLDICVNNNNHEKGYEFNETFIEYIVNYLPNLQSLRIEDPIRLTERTADIVSRLSRLQTLELNILDISLIDSFENIIIKNCRKIKSIEIKLYTYSP